MNSISSPINRFNLRVYGVLIEDGQILLTDEFRFGKKMTKLPGGGLEFGEGIEDALKREWMEELQTKIEVGAIVHVNPFLQVSAFNPSQQVICFYFRVSLREKLAIPISTLAFDFPLNGQDQQSFRWKKLSELQTNDFTFPIDQSLIPIIRNM